MWLNGSLRSMGVFKQIKSDYKYIRMHIHRLQELVTIKYQMHYEYG